MLLHLNYLIIFNHLILNYCSFQISTVPEYRKKLVFTSEAAIRNKDILDTICPIRNSIVSDWDAMEKIWYHMYYEDLLVPPENYNILHTEVDMNLKSSREKMFEVNDFINT